VVPSVAIFAVKLPLKRLPPAEDEVVVSFLFGLLSAVLPASDLRGRAVGSSSDSSSPTTIGLSIAMAATFGFFQRFSEVHWSSVAMSHQWASATCPYTFGFDLAGRLATKLSSFAWVVSSVVTMMMGVGVAVMVQVLLLEVLEELVEVVVVVVVLGGGPPPPAALPTTAAKTAAIAAKIPVAAATAPPAALPIDVNP
jgi:hypothetical protein